MTQKIVLRYVLPIAALLCPTIAHADAAFMTGNMLLENCHKEKLFVLGYMMGVVDKGLLDSDVADWGLEHEPGSIQLKVVGKFVRTNRCVPDRVTSGQMVDVVCKWLDDHPADRHKYGPSLIASAFENAWPCE
ncbi:hypothetical protein RHEC894_CH00108 [Rhizobium sp. CIAT894]|nr:hypothetical protein RHEC894_CH00108 [Rhizobium sp. CIAT894]